MHVEEMRIREDYDTILHGSLEQGLSDWLGRQVQVSPAGRGQSWFYQRLFSAYHTRDVGREVRRWLAMSLRRTPRTWLAPAQYIGATLAATKPGTVLLGQEAFALSEGVPRPELTLIMPGNQRIRTFCFATGISRVWPKVGFSRRRLEVEVETRRAERARFFVPLVAWGRDFSWLEEEVIEGVPLPRSAPAQRSKLNLKRLFDELEDWSAESGREVGSPEYAAHLAQECIGKMALLHARFQRELGARWRLEPLIRCASRLGPVALWRSHGDLQPGNVLVTSDGPRLIDWEHAGERMAGYDRLVFGLGARRGNWTKRLALPQGPAQWPLQPALPGRKRLPSLALFALEDLAWHLREATSGPYLGLTLGVQSASRAAVEVARACE